MEGDSHIRRTFLHPQSHVATVTTSLIPKDLDSYTSLQVNACDWGRNLEAIQPQVPGTSHFLHTKWLKPMGVTMSLKAVFSIYKIFGVLV